LLRWRERVEGGRAAKEGRTEGNKQPPAEAKGI